MRYNSFPTTNAQMSLQMSLKYYIFKKKII